MPCPNKTLSVEFGEGRGSHGGAGISLEDIVVAIEFSSLLDILHHPNQGKYPQRILVVGLDNYAYPVPFAEEEESRPSLPQNHHTEPARRQGIT
jgi:hypothetical protein